MALICLVTDRRRVSAAYGQGDCDRVVRLVAAAAEAGIDLVQVRERDLDGAELAGLVSRCLEAVAGSPLRLVVNERVDVALACGAHGVHLRGDSMAAPRVRTIAPPGFTVGRSVHNAIEASRHAEAGGLDYILFGAVFRPTGKPDGAGSQGTAPLADVVRSVTLPVLAIGGVGIDRLPAIARTGAAGFAAIGLFVDAAGPAALARIVRDARKTFDTPPGPP